MILDLGSQYTLVIARQVTKLGVQCRVVKPNELPGLEGIKGTILSGSPFSVYEKGAPQVPEHIFESRLPLLGICYGMQYMVYRENKNAVWSKEGSREYGPIGVELNGTSRLFDGLPNVLRAWASHGDTVHTAPNYRVTATSVTVGISAVEHERNPWYGVQFHPEVDHTEDEDKILCNFLYQISGCRPDWDAHRSIEHIAENTLQKLGENGRALMGVSGGVDSTTIAAILAPKLRDRFHPILIDHGGMRQGEVAQVKETCVEYGINLVVIDAGVRFMASMNVLDAETKRRAFQAVYRQVFQEEVEKRKITHILQGTLATDLIESGAAGVSAKIKTHHNVGLSFEREELTPFSHLFKHEVRDLARTLQFSFAERQPFPGPGLYLRMPGIIPNPDSMECLRAADHLVTEILKDEGLYDGISQLVVALAGFHTVGVQGDSRSYMHPVIVRAVQTSDFMTAAAVRFPEEVRMRITSEITSHGLSNRVLWDETPKPPATTEFE